MSFCCVAGLAGVLFAASVPASPHNPDTDRFREAGWGVFVHYLWDVQNVGGRENTQGKPPITWDALVREFDTERFAEQVQETGAPYVFFSGKNFATHFQVQLSPDHSAWRTVAEVKDHDGAKWEKTFAAVSARYVRVRVKAAGEAQSLAPQGDQPLRNGPVQNQRKRAALKGCASMPRARWPTSAFWI